MLARISPPRHSGVGSQKYPPGFGSDSQQCPLPHHRRAGDRSRGARLRTLPGAQGAARRRAHRHRPEGAVDREEIANTRVSRSLRSNRRARCRRRTTRHDHGRRAGHVLEVNGFRRVHCNCTAAMRNQRRSVLRRRNARRFRAFYKRRLHAGDFCDGPARPGTFRQANAGDQSRPRRDGVVIVTVLMVFLAGMTLGGMLAGSASEPTRVAMNDTVPVAPDGLPLTVRQ
jgi:hypothetical protein